MLRLEMAKETLGVLEADLKLEKVSRRVGQAKRREQLHES
jgi:hypothetical protein